VDHLQNYQEMRAPFQGIEDDLGGKLLPTLPLEHLQPLALSTAKSGTK
jgi:hypothetical protein